MMAIYFKTRRISVIIATLICFVNINFAINPAVPQLSIRQNGEFANFELSNPSDISYISESEGVLDMEFVLRSGLKKQIPVNEIDSMGFCIPKLPVISLSFPDFPEATQIWDKKEYIDANMDIYKNSEDDDEELSEIALKIRGRGNSTWGMQKKPMRLKFSKKISLLGMKAAKNYVLLANYLDPSHLKNMITFWVGQEMGCCYTPPFKLCNVFINDQYVGVFLLSAKVGINSGSVNVDESKSILFELDNTLDEDFTYLSPIYNLPVMVKDPDLNEIAAEDSQGRTAEEIFEEWQSDFNKAEEKIEKGEIWDAFDLTDFVNYYFVQSLVYNHDITQPKSVFIFKEGIGEEDKYHFGPLWDFDATCNVYKNINGEKILKYPAESKFYSHKIFQKMCATEEYKELYLQRFAYFYDNVYPGMLELIDNVGKDMEESAELDGKRWSMFEDFEWALRYPSSNYKLCIEDLRSWLVNRVEYLKKQANAGEVY